MMMGEAVGRIYKIERIDTAPDVRWSWSITVYVDPMLGIATSAKVVRRWRKRKHSFGRIGGGRTRIPAPLDEAVMQTRLMEPTLTSVPILKFAHLAAPSDANFGIKGTLATL